MHMFVSHYEMLMTVFLLLLSKVQTQSQRAERKFTFSVVIMKTVFLCQNYIVLHSKGFFKNCFWFYFHFIKKKKFFSHSKVLLCMWNWLNQCLKSLFVAWWKNQTMLTMQKFFLLKWLIDENKADILIFFFVSLRQQAKVPNSLFVFFYNILYASYSLWHLNINNLIILWWIHINHVSLVTMATIMCWCFTTVEKLIIALAVHLWRYLTTDTSSVTLVTQTVNAALMR